MGPSMFNFTELSGSAGAGLNSSERRASYLEEKMEQNAQFVLKQKINSRSQSRKGS